MSLVDTINATPSLRSHLLISTTRRTPPSIVRCDSYSFCVWSQDGVVGPLQRFLSTPKLNQQATSGLHARHLGRPVLSLDEAMHEANDERGTDKDHRKKREDPTHQGLCRTDSRVLKLRFPHGSAPRFLIVSTCASAVIRTQA